MITNGQSVAYVSQALGISEALIYNRDGGPLETTYQRGRKTTPARTDFRHTSGESTSSTTCSAVRSWTWYLKKSLEHFQSTDLRQRYELVKCLAEDFSVETLCLVLGLSRTAYYRYLRGASYQLNAEKENNQQLVEQVFAKHKRRYGSRRIIAELKDKGYLIGRYQVRAIMKRVGLQAIQPHGRPRKIVCTADNWQQAWKRLLRGGPCRQICF